VGEASLVNRDKTATEEFIQARLQLAKAELERQDDCDYKVLNDNLAETAETIYQLIQTYNKKSETI